MLQGRMSPSDPRLYNVYRDLGHNFAYVIRVVSGRLENEACWPPLTRLLRQHQVSQEQLGKACECFILFMKDMSNPKDTMETCLDRSGWLELPEIVHVAFFAVLGTVVTGMAWAGIREATCFDSQPLLTYEGLTAYGERAARLLTMPRWQRWLFRWRNKLARVWRAVRS